MIVEITSSFNFSAIVRGINRLYVGYMSDDMMKQLFHQSKKTLKAEANFFQHQEGASAVALTVDQHVVVGTNLAQAKYDKSLVKEDT